MNAPTLGTPSKTRERVLVGMPLYDGKPEWQTARGWAQIEANPHLVSGVELVAAKVRLFSAGTARNLIMALAKKEKCGRVVFIDHDMVFDERGQLARLLSHDVPIVSGLCPKRNPAKLEWACKFLGSDRGDGLRLVRHAGGAFLSVSMQAVVQIEAHNPQTAYISTLEAFFGLTVHHLFAEQIVMNDWDNPGKPAWPQWQPEDVHFCHLARKAGLPIYVDTRCPVGHIGTVDFLELHRQMETLRKSAQNPPTNTADIVS